MNIILSSSPCSAEDLIVKSFDTPKTGISQRSESYDDVKDRGIIISSPGERVTLVGAELALEARRQILKMTSRAQSAHVASALSVVDIVAAIYSCVPFDSGPTGFSSSRNRLFFSKGHAASALYSVLALKGFFPIDWLDRYCLDGAELGGHVTYGVPGVELSTGSLGHGLPFAVGVALANKREESEARTFVVMSDGELNEGSNWEALLVASHHNLSRIDVFIDRNRLQSLRNTENTLALEPLAAKFEAFGWIALTIDGHDHGQLERVLSEKDFSGPPRAIICETVKGKGVSFMENQVKWHYRPPNESELVAALSELSLP